jgi:hypothetical protein
MANMYSNIPITKVNNDTVEAFENYFSSPVEINTSVLAAMTAYFTSRGFGQVAAESIAVTIITQARQDDYNPMQILDTLRGLDTVELSAIVSEILNYNRFKTSSLGYAQTIVPNEEVYRNIIDYSNLVDSYSVTASADSINEGGTVVFTINAVNASNGTTLFWNLSGTDINSEDIVGGNLTGTVVIYGGVASVAIATNKTTTVESNETLTFSLRKKSFTGAVVATASTLLLKTVTTFNADYIVIEYRFLSGKDLDTRTRLVTPPVGSYLGWSRGITVQDFLEWSGDNTGTGTEAILFNINNFREQYPNVSEIILDCRAQWYSIAGTDPMRLRISSYDGGTMVKDNYNWTNPTAIRTSVLDTDLKVITLLTTDPASIGERVATFKYNLNTGQGFLDPTDTTTYP